MSDKYSIVISEVWWLGWSLKLLNDDMKFSGEDLINLSQLQDVVREYLWKRVENDTVPIAPNHRTDPLTSGTFTNNIQQPHSQIVIPSYNPSDLSNQFDDRILHKQRQALWWWTSELHGGELCRPGWKLGIPKYVCVSSISIMNKWSYLHIPSNRRHVPNCWQ